MFKDGVYWDKAESNEKRKHVISLKSFNPKKFQSLVWWLDEGLMTYFLILLFFAKSEGMGGEHKSTPYYVNNR